MNLGSIFAAILMFFTNVFSSIRNVFSNIFNNEPIISNSTIVPTIPITEITEITDTPTFQETNKVKEITEIIDTPTLEETNVAKELTNTPIFDETNEVMCTYKVEIPEYTYFPACDSSYNSLVDALKSIGAKSDSSYRAIIAELNGIIDYKYTSEQNTELLNKLKSGTLIQSKEIKIETKNIPCDKETTFITNEVIPNTNEVTPKTENPTISTPNLPPSKKQNISKFY